MQMKIRDIIIEQNEIRSADVKISRTAKQAEQTFFSADIGALEKFDPEEVLAKVNRMYGVRFVDDYKDVFEKPNGEKDTDKKDSLLTKDNRK